VENKEHVFFLKKSACKKKKETEGTASFSSSGKSTAKADTVFGQKYRLLVIYPSHGRQNALRPTSHVTRARMEIG